MEGLGTLEGVGVGFSTGGEDNFEGIGCCTGYGRTGTGVIVVRDGSAVTGGGLKIIGRLIYGGSKFCGEGRESVELLVNNSIRDWLHFFNLALYCQ